MVRVHPTVPTQLNCPVRIAALVTVRLVSASFHTLKAMPTSARALGCILVVACCIADAKAKGGNYLVDEPYNPQHITSLPPEIRASVYAICGEPRALHTFAEYRDNLRTVTLHFERLLCGISEVRCSASGCLHEVFTLTRSGRYQLTRRYYAKEPSF